MKRLFAAFVAFCLLLPPLVALEKDVPKEALAEIGRRGNMIEQVGGIQDDGQQAFCDAVAVPADDSHKWFISIVTMRGCQPCEQLRADFARSPVLKNWVDVDDYKRSWAHFQVFQIEDPTQKDRWAALKQQGVSFKTFPVLIVQPPLNGAFGDPRTVVMMLEGYNKPEQIDKQLREAIDRYAKKVAPQHSAWRAERHEKLAINAAGFEQQAGAAPPFSVAPPLGPPNLTLPTVPPGPTAATLDQLRANCPGAPADFLLTQLQAQATVEQAQIAWLKQQAADEKAKEPAKEPEKKPETQTPAPATPASGLSQILMLLAGLLGGGFLSGLIVFALKFFRNQRKEAGQPLLIPSDATFDELMALLTNLGHNPVAIPRTPISAAAR